MLNALKVINAKPIDWPYKLYDARGLYLLVKPNGSRGWRWNCRYLPKTADIVGRELPRCLPRIGP